MPVAESNLERLYQTHIKGLKKGAMVPDVTILVVKIPHNLVVACGLPRSKVYITVRALKHMHENRKEEDFKFITNNIWAALKFPTCVYENLEGKRGGYLFVKKMINDHHYACSVELKKGSLEDNKVLFIVTAFRNTNQRYFDKCKLIWSRKGGKPSS